MVYFFFRAKRRFLRRADPSLRRRLDFECGALRLI